MAEITPKEWGNIKATVGRIEGYIYGSSDFPEDAPNTPLYYLMPQIEKTLVDISRSMKSIREDINMNQRELQEQFSLMDQRLGVLERLQNSLYIIIAFGGVAVLASLFLSLFALSQVLAG
ncbi:MAG: hypothetical protein GY938_16690 [Ketobacter sp.]|nr:hypothetical protein [Ketobacter sp.]